jgi:hypothetical protein
MIGESTMSVIRIILDTDDDFFVNTNMEKKNTFIDKTFYDEDTAISFIQSWHVENLKERHFKPATQYVETLKSQFIQCIKSQESTSGGGNWEYHLLID